MKVKPSLYNPLSLFEGVLPKQNKSIKKDELIQKIDKVFSKEVLRLTRMDSTKSCKLRVENGNKLNNYKEITITGDIIVPKVIVFGRCNSKTITAIPGMNDTVAFLQMLTIEIWNTRGGFHVSTIHLDERIDALCYAGLDDTGKIPLLATAKYSGIITLWDVNSGKKYKRYDFDFSIYTMVNLQQSIIAISGEYVNKILIYDIVKGEKIQVLDIELEYCMCLNSLNSELLACGDQFGGVEVWQWNTNKRVISSAIDSLVVSMCLLDSNTILVGGDGGKLFQCNLQESGPGKQVYGPVGSIMALQKIDATHVACGFNNSSIQILDTTTWTPSWIGTSYIPYGFCQPNPDGSFAFVWANPIEGSFARNYLMLCRPSEIFKQMKQSVYVGKNGKNDIYASVTYKGELCITSGADVYYPSNLETVSEIIYLGYDGMIALKFTDCPMIAIWNCCIKCEIAVLSMDSPVVALNAKSQHQLACRLENGVTQIWDWQAQEIMYEYSSDESSADNRFFDHILEMCNNLFFTVLNTNKP